MSAIHPSLVTPASFSFVYSFVQGDQAALVMIVHNMLLTVCFERQGCIYHYSLTASVWVNSVTEGRLPSLATFHQWTQEGQETHTPRISPSLYSTSWPWTTSSYTTHISLDTHYLARTSSSTKPSWNNTLSCVFLSRFRASVEAKIQPTMMPLPSQCPTLSLTSADGQCT